MVDPKVSEKENFGKEVYVDVKAWMIFHLVEEMNKAV